MNICIYVYIVYSTHPSRHEKGFSERLTRQNFDKVHRRVKECIYYIDLFIPFVKLMM